MEIKTASIEELEARKAEIAANVDNDGADLDALTEEVRNINTEIEERKKAAAQKAEIRASVAAGQEGKTMEIKTPELTENEKRAAAFVANGSRETIEARSILVSGGTIATPTGVGKLRDIVGGTSISLLDMVYVNDCKGMASNIVPYEAAEANAASAQTEGSAGSAAETTFGKVTINAASKACVAQISKQVKQQSPIQYETKVRAAAEKSLRKAAVAAITDAMKTDAAKDSGSLCTIVTATLDSSSKGTVGATTLRDLVFAYGADDEMSTGKVLLLNKTDLIALGDIRGTNEKKPVYEIIPDGANPNTGIIKDGGLIVKYCIVSSLTACHGTSQSSTANVPTMFYGDPMTAIELDLFSDYAVRVSEDFAFTSMLDTIVGDVQLGAGVVQKNGFAVLRIAKA